MFVSCKNSMFHCYTYSKKNSHGTCTTKANPNNCNIYTKAKPAMSQQTYSIFKSDAECWPTSKYGLHRHPAITSLDGCAAVARHTGVKMFVSCRNSAGYFCYTYVNSKTQGTCTTRANPNKCDTYSASLAAEAQSFRLLKSNAECWPTSTYGLRKEVASSLNECAAKTRNAGVNMFLSCSNKEGFWCYTYRHTNVATTCHVKPNPYSCSVYVLTENTASNNAAWSSWTAWGACSSDCGDGLQERTRTCVGKGTCYGDISETKACNKGECVKVISNFVPCDKDSPMNLATCEEEKLRVECQVEGRPKTSKVRCPMGTNNWLCKGVREEEEIACCDYACD